MGLDPNADFFNDFVRRMWPHFSPAIDITYTVRLVTEVMVGFCFFGHFLNLEYD